MRSALRCIAPTEVNWIGTKVFVEAMERPWQSEDKAAPRMDHRCRRLDAAAFHRGSLADQAELTARRSQSGLCPAFYSNIQLTSAGFAVLIARGADVFCAASWSAMRKVISPAGFQSTPHNLAGGTIHRKNRGATGRNE